MRKMQALGLIETRGFTGAVEALDVAVKTADVTLIGVEFIGSGLVTVQITGDVSAVKVSIDAAVIGAQRVGEVVAAHVIPRPFDDVAKILKIKEEEKEVKPEPEPKLQAEPELEEELKLEEDAQAGEKQVLEQETEDEPESVKESKSGPYTLDELNAMKVVDLRTLLRSLPGLKIKRNQIKFMNKEELLEAIQKFYDQQ